MQDMKTGNLSSFSHLQFLITDLRSGCDKVFFNNHFNVSNIQLPRYWGFEYYTAAVYNKMLISTCISFSFFYIFLSVQGLFCR